MSKRGLALFLTGMIIIIAISVTAGVRSYNDEQRKQASDQAQQELNDQMTTQGWYAYEYHKLEDSTVTLFTNADGTILGLGIMKMNGEFSSSTRDTIEETPFDWAHLGNGTDEYIGIRLNEQPEDVVYLRLQASGWSKIYTVNDPQDEGYVRTYLITLEKTLRGDWTLETLDHEKNVLHSEQL
ncbi:hypothetical protein EVJ33_07245 [Exiguobacterium sp. SL-10]|uniref:hypothetical protein n=1 Tax=unclassified Exiguobacterium TaxID=2644629 RepID=UPI00103D4C7E|nr:MULTISPECIES: hypothetical protein [unclassified Exiguobacterium]TCI21495.1 hypothetical protein EVJ34_09525 [Exiguobacterium sp. SL-9]TCI29928.1 hypothetical protein EVJ33_07245 [Exiguobacterium sp. SL-10]